MGVGSRGGGNKVEEQKKIYNSIKYFKKQKKIPKNFLLDLRQILTMMPQIQLNLQAVTYFQHIAG